MNLRGTMGLQEAISAGWPRGSGRWFAINSQKMFLLLRLPRAPGAARAK